VRVSVKGHRRLVGRGEGEALLGCRLHLVGGEIDEETR
jgi:hypothetical protein